MTNGSADALPACPAAARHDNDCRIDGFAAMKLTSEFVKKAI